VFSYADVMTKLLEKAVAVARRLPPDEQDEIARLMLSLAGDEEPVPVPLSPDERAAIATSKSAAVRGEFASDEEVCATWAKYFMPYGMPRAIPPGCRVPGIQSEPPLSSASR
jgi:hypothetical protein